MSTPGPAFIKWDARPANATRSAGDRVVWFDWEHARRRWCADDLVWFLNDETIPDDARAHELLLGVAASREGDPHWAPEPQLEYVVALGICHLCVRIHQALDPRRRSLWDRWEDCVENDWAGAGETVIRLARRGTRLAPESRSTAPLAAFFDALARHAASFP